MIHLPSLQIHSNVRISDLPIPDVALIDMTSADVAELIRYIESKRRQPRHSTTVRGLRLIKGNRP